jgi:hypothetical protein
MGSYDPEGWARRWARFAGGCLLLGFLVPAGVSWSLSDWAPLDWAGREPSLLKFAVLYAPPVAGTSLLVAAFLGSHGGLVAALVAATLLQSLVVFLAFDAMSNAGFTRPLRAFGLYLGLYGGPAAVVVGGHLRWYHASSATARWFSCVGGVVAAASLAWLFSAGGFPRYFEFGFLLFLFGAFSFVVLGLLGVRRDSRGSARLARWLGRATLVGALGLTLLSGPRWLPLTLKSALLFAGFVVVPPLAAAGFCERRVARTADRTRLAEVFE